MCRNYRTLVKAIAKSKGLVHSQGAVWSSLELLFPIPRELVPSEPSEGGQPVTPVEHRQICDFGVVRRADGQSRGGVDEDDKARALASRQPAV